MDEGTRRAGQLQSLTALVQHFCEERDWDQFHGPKDLAIGLSTEASELLELFRFKGEAECDAVLKDPIGRGKVEDELADVFFFVLRLAQRHGIDLEAALRAKVAKNAAKYPVEKSRGSNRKYDEL
jgi:NTP pyrophosphatase (non-canonical NTP hydrolase)